MSSVTILSLHDPKMRCSESRVAVSNLAGFGINVPYFIVSTVSSTGIGYSRVMEHCLAVSRYCSWSILHTVGGVRLLRFNYGESLSAGEGRNVRAVLLENDVGVKSDRPSQSLLVLFGSED
ncbi:hypothetical protein BDV30DRAFT_207051 [Aspergillus minisclerotigenes]|uniref:Uncharacterized protein n=1 Tax=Aspergillus minisclerotigenes TaxID=656917 RepID=A0A5N6JAZ2_9EURO|nr:hypothetical protein BDV30DRAFT_207051 [Aspergillus minisclerotigenes]